ncbi:hypothetical protein WOSG25_210140 [Weissella oryzae SG25]|uniref:DUF378 domain-containing protein n=1 Tax=Weissella oryzae (strain DSM 25784 / JCM 18191 / LMG 30913 / SG25) TaxID=1329250 RepID=A0A069CX52_WEIOS|nr:DUF378 domain-containing protein [Weissella oryzae]GAK31957.1 hypothetical protein WOSG25_210140 [Weissella oryzae SG25]
MKALDITALVVLIIGGLNWLLVGLFKFDLVQFIFSGLGFAGDVIARIVYVLVGLSALYAIKFIKSID